MFVWLTCSSAQSAVTTTAAISSPKASAPPERPPLTRRLKCFNATPFSVLVVDRIGYVFSMYHIGIEIRGSAMTSSPRLSHQWTSFEALHLHPRHDVPSFEALHRHPRLSYIMLRGSAYILASHLISHCLAAPSLEALCTITSSPRSIHCTHMHKVTICANVVYSLPDSHSMSTGRSVR